MELRPIIGYRLTSVLRFESGNIVFTVSRADGTQLTRNRVTKENEKLIELRTRILSDAPAEAEEAAMVADLEQCAALALLGIVPAEHKVTS
jgi:hypothetical protein